MIQVDIRSRVPIYEQLYENIRRLILQGILEADQKIPSVRELAAQLTINPNTIQKAYRALEKDGYIYCVSGRGNFVSTLDRQLMSQEAEKALEQIGDKVDEAVLLKIPESDVLALVKGRYSKEEKDD